jgi:hypothetical protein
MTNISTIVSSGGASSGSSSPIRRLNKSTNGKSPMMTQFVLLRSYSKLLFYILIALFITLQYMNYISLSLINVKDSTTTFQSKIASWNDRTQTKTVQSKSRQEKQVDEEYNKESVKIHIVFSTGCNAFQDCK